MSQPLPEHLQFVPSDRDKMALTVFEQLKGCKPTYNLKNEQRRLVNDLIKALKTGEKSKVYHYSRDFSAALLTEDKIRAAYMTVVKLQVPGNPNFSIIMDWLKERYWQADTQTLKSLPLDEALTILLLAVTNTPHKSISYKRLKIINGEPQFCSTGCPLNRNILADFLMPFGAFSGLLERAIVFHQEIALSNPAAVLGEAHALEREHWLQACKAWEASRQLSEKPKPDSAIPNSQPVIKNLSDRHDALYELCRTPAEAAAASLALEETQLRKIACLAEAPPSIFLDMLRRLYLQKLQPHQAQDLAERMAESFQALVQELRRLAGKDWLRLWREIQIHKGQNPSLLPAVDAHTQAAEDPITASLRKQAQMQDKIDGAKFLAKSQQHENQTDFPGEELRPELVRVVAELSLAKNFQDFCRVILLTEYENTEELLNLMKKAFSAGDQQTLPEIKADFLAGLSLTQRTHALQLIARVELGCHQLSKFYAREPKLPFDQVLSRLESQSEQEALRARRTSAAFRNSAAGHYQKYAGEAGV